ncbi:C-type lectin domain family 4 member M CD209 antigen-like protein 1 [Channa argus]|uniref:C-type lectin domain family 4 member M CD209 antigen-like protein 1 n=1 Tax=Channa argus TaxID=215402 RepID=A0A6G1PQ50_CHAAH|nr:C-type lectin domain family 4 member M CD209 antigen-like protein 1 [Channa argus]KAK2909872.1 hypothetical protein Q8A73_007587 [Channa argus]
MLEELNYVTVTFRSNSVSLQNKPIESEIIYEEVKTEEQACDTHPVIPENEKKAPFFTLLHLIAVGLGVICVILVSFVIALSIQLNKVTSEQQSQNTSFEKQKKGLIEERDRLNWTMETILEQETFYVKDYCVEKVCKPCLENWVLFQSTCYLFSEYRFYSSWKNWDGSREDCRQRKADLVVIDSQEEQEFIKNHIKNYHDDNHGYWIGLRSINIMDTWMWVDKRNVTTMYWNTKKAGKGLCALSLPNGDLLSNWQKTGCDMRNRWICETRALIK